MFDADALTNPAGRAECADVLRAMRLALGEWLQENRDPVAAEFRKKTG